MQRTIGVDSVHNQRTCELCDPTCSQSADKVQKRNSSGSCVQHGMLGERTTAHMLQPLYLLVQAAREVAMLLVLARELAFQLRHLQRERKTI